MGLDRAYARSLVTMMNFALKPKSRSTSAFINLKLINRYVSLLLWFYKISGLGAAPYIKLTHRIEVLWTSNGAQFVVTYLKECHRLCQFYIAGTPSTNQTQLRLGVAHGLPTILPKSLRLVLTGSDSRIAWKVVLALLSLYRVIKYPGVLKLSSITDDFKGLDTRLPQVEVALCYNRLFKKLVGTPEKGARLLPIRTAGPNSKISFLGAPLDAYHIAVKCPNLVGYFATIAKFFDSEIF